MTTVVDSEQFNAERSKRLKSVRVDGESFVIQFHGRPFAAVVPYEQLKDERRELDELRALIADLKNRLQEAADLEEWLLKIQERSALAEIDAEADRP